MCLELTLKFNYKSAWVNSTTKEWVCIWFACLNTNTWNVLVASPPTQALFPSLAPKPWYFQHLTCLFRLFGKLPVELCWDLLQLNCDWQCLCEEPMLDLSCCIHRLWIKGSFDVTQAPPLYLSTELCANFCCFVSSVPVTLLYSCSLCCCCFFKGGGRREGIKWWLG